MHLEFVKPDIELEVVIEKWTLNLKNGKNYSKLWRLKGKTSITDILSLNFLLFFNNIS